MTRDEIIAMAREAGFQQRIATPNEWWCWESSINRFAALVEQAATEEANRRANASWALMCEKRVGAEREACARIAEQSHTREQSAAAIRARGQA